MKVCSCSGEPGVSDCSCKLRLTSSFSRSRRSQGHGWRSRRIDGEKGPGFARMLFMRVTPHGSVELVRSGVFANIHWGLIDIGGTGDILFLIGCVRAALVLLEAANESGTDTDGAGDGAHDILGERSGLVSADDGGVCHRLTRTEGANEEIFLIRFVAKVSARVTASGKPCGTATTTSVTEMMSVKAMPFSLPVLRKRVRVGTEVVKGKTLAGRGPSAQLNGEGRKPLKPEFSPA